MTILNKTILFDLDGTLLDTLDDLADSVNFALRSVSLPERSRGEIRSFVGNGMRNLIRRSVPPECDIGLEEQIFGVFKTHYAENCAVKTAPYPHIASLLERLKLDGFKLGVVSNKNDARVKELINHYFPGTFDVICGERENIKKKPAPDSVLECMKQLGSSNAETVYIGDSDVDSLTAKNADIKCILVSWGFRDRSFLESQCADVIADDVCGLYDNICEFYKNR